MAAETDVPNHQAEVNPGAQLAAALVESLVLTNEAVRKLSKVVKVQAAIIDELNGRLEAFANTMDSLAEISQSKGKLSLADFAQEFSIANDEIFGDDAGDEKPAETEEDDD